MSAQFPMTQDGYEMISRKRLMILKIEGRRLRKQSKRLGKKVICVRMRIIMLPERNWGC